jgi:hypothetical protein
MYFFLLATTSFVNMLYQIIFKNQISKFLLFYIQNMFVKCMLNLFLHTKERENEIRMKKIKCIFSDYLKKSKGYKL